ncbi:DUF3768 domain-containing protein [Dokdonia sp.]|uniref:DUF3768 domain-containing protein n=1 Tax=Dokdonia sp. TaxID=2024995 RepID=UPI003267627C
MAKDKAKLIAEQNDLFRQNFGSNTSNNKEVKGQYCVTEGFNNLPLGDRLVATMKIRKFDNFNPDNDPYKEHDMGRFKQNAHTILWKIDYYDLNYEYGSPEPSDSTKTRRVLTAMLGNEY